MSESKVVGRWRVDHAGLCEGDTADVTLRTWRESGEEFIGVYVEGSPAGPVRQIASFAREHGRLHGRVVAGFVEIAVDGGRSPLDAIIAALQSLRDAVLPEDRGNPPEVVIDPSSFIREVRSDFLP